MAFRVRSEVERDASNTVNYNNGRLEFECDQIRKGAQFNLNN